ncbi:MAG: hypothetical protein IPK12_17695 [Gemmatimonadetes bacterium]|nr:hypothetical protein [Gemmatimonadota bacterium]
MTHETLTSLPGTEVLARAKRFFQERVPNYAAFPEKEGPTFLQLRGQGGEEIAIAVAAAEQGTRVRASTLLFDREIGRFFTTLPGGPA